MKTITTTEKIPAYEVQHQAFACEEPGCGFTTGDEGEAEKHHGKKHSVSGRTSIDDITFLRFETQEKFDAWMATRAEDEYHADRFYKGTWSGPGWYGLFYGSEPCGRGCCTDTTLRIHAAKSLKSAWRDEAREKIRNLITLSKLVN